MRRKKSSLLLRPFDPVDHLKGIGPRLAEGLAENGIHQVVDLLFHLPSRYEDRSRTTPLNEIRNTTKAVLVRCRVFEVRVLRRRRRGSAVISGVLRDAGGSLPVVWFNQRWVDRRLKDCHEVFLYGAVRKDRNQVLQMVNPEVEEVEDERGEGIVPVYPRLGPLGGRRLRRIIAVALEAVDHLEDPLPTTVRERLGISDLATSVAQLHNPKLVPGSAGFDHDLEQLNRGTSPGRLRLVLDEAIAFSCAVVDHVQRRRNSRSLRCEVDGELRRRMAAVLPFTLTAAQKRVLGEILNDLARPFPMARLLQGDVGSGKTVVAALALLAVAHSGHQGALMAPTELLSEQHHSSLNGLLAGAGLEVALLTSSQPVAVQREVRSGLAQGSIRLVVGTHSLFQEGVSFHNLAMVVVDEQHRFGVQARQRLVDKGAAPHVLVMTATPIPRTLALTAYGDLDLSEVDEVPPGRKPVRTVLRPASARRRVLDFVAREVQRGHRAFIVCPLIESSESLASRALEDAVVEVCEVLPAERVGVLHGRLSREERESVQRAFRNGEVQVLVATTVVEVGVDVPEATVMIVESADRFGLSQLHQLRGRVGRGEGSSWCVVLADSQTSDESMERLQLFCSCQDGFEIAEADLRLRGPGEIAGDRQWGPASFRFIDLLRHQDQLLMARRLVESLRSETQVQELQRGLARFHRAFTEINTG